MGYVFILIPDYIFMNKGIVQIGEDIYFSLFYTFILHW